MKRYLAAVTPSQSNTVCKLMTFFIINWKRQTTSGRGPYTYLGSISSKLLHILMLWHSTYYAQLYQYTQLEVATNCYAIISFLFVSKISVNPLAQNLFLTPSVNFISILRAAFTNADPKSAKK